MTVFETIRNRRTIYEFKPDPVPNETIARILESAVWAPNHKLTEPWRFIVISGRVREKLAAVYCRIQREKTRSDDPEVLETATRKGYAKFMSKPALVAVICRKDPEPFRAREDYAAACCAIQNISLSAWEQGVGMQWSTSAILTDAEALDLLRIDPETEEMIALLYTGFPALIPEQKRIPATERTAWLD
ncbi:MAG: nitroreductase [candidate division Zixibacteria bacterium]|nr:nitroreductase [candidate division Zixibacteria bacterium]